MGWLGAYILPLGWALTNTVILQTSTPVGIQHYIDIINKYKVGTTSSIKLACQKNGPAVPQRSVEIYRV